MTATATAHGGHSPAPPRDEVARLSPTAPLSGHQQTPIARPADENRARGHQDQQMTIGPFATVAGTPPPDGDDNCADADSGR